MFMFHNFPKVDPEDDPYHWWKEKSRKFNTVAEIARQNLCISACVTSTSYDCLATDDAHKFLFICVH